MSYIYLSVVICIQTQLPVYVHTVTYAYTQDIQSVLYIYDIYCMYIHTQLTLELATMISNHNPMMAYANLNF